MDLRPGLDAMKMSLVLAGKLIPIPCSSSPYPGHYDKGSVVATVLQVRVMFGMRVLVMRRPDTVMYSCWTSGIPER